MNWEIRASGFSPPLPPHPPPVIKSITPQYMCRNHFCLPAYLSIRKCILSTCPSIRVYIFLVCLSNYPCAYLSVSIRLSVCISFSLSIDLSICLSIYLSVCLFIYSSVYSPVNLSLRLSIGLSVYQSILLPIRPSAYLSIRLSIFLSVWLSFYPSVYLSIRLSIGLSVSVYSPCYLSFSPA